MPAGEGPEAARSLQHGENTPGSQAVATADWRGTDRYQVRRRIGAGAMGTVYEAVDRETSQVVALKKLRHFTPAALYLFKQEFRTLVDVRHTNLVRLYEFVATEAREAFFTMELLRGRDFLEHVRERGVLDVDRLREGLRQLLDGVQALHAAGKLHRDIKPSNVLVTPEGRLVLLDFGVATQFVGAAAEDLREEHPIVGTASYMAPEQASNASLSPASDLYSIGAILFEALVGRPPFVGSVLEVIRLKGMKECPSASQCASDVPPDLDALCTGLLRRDPAARPAARDIRRGLGVGSERGSVVLAATDPLEESSLVGREDHLRVLRRAFEAARAGESVTVRAHGPSGMGKSALVQIFLEDVAKSGESVVLRGRAYERESVPYKAIDSWVDALSRHLLRLSDRGAVPPLPKDVWALTRLFPVLRRVPEIADVREEVIADPHRIRRRAFVALRELLASLAQSQPVIVSIDDVHWGDQDSADLLLDLVRPPAAPPLLLLMTYRPQDQPPSAFLAAMAIDWPEGAEVRDLTVGPLETSDARRLALRLIGCDDDAARLAALEIAAESRGSPFLVEELVGSHRKTARNGSAHAAVTLEQLVEERLLELPESTRVVAETVAVGGRPLRVSILPHATAVASDLTGELDVLREKRFVRSGLRDGHEVVEITHDRIREAIVARLAPDRVRDRHAKLAAALEAVPGGDPEAIAVHLLGSGDPARAAPFAARAAEEAIAKLAFDRAAELFRSALDGTDESSSERRRLASRLGLALAWSGHGVEAARVYLDAADGAPGLQRLELERAAAEQLLASGRVDEGAEVLRRVLTAIGVPAPRSTLSALVWLMLYRFWLAVMGLRFRERAPEEVSEQDRLRIDAMYAVAIAFAAVDVVVGACTQARHLIAALRAGDRFQVVRATALEAGHLASLGGAEGKRERALNDLGRRLAAQTGNAEAEAFRQGNLGIGLFLRGRWKQARTVLDESNAKLLHGHAHWQSNSRLFSVRSLYFSGQIKEIVRRQGPLYTDASDRGDLYTTVNFDTTTTITMHLAADDPEGARSRTRRGLGQWSQSAFFVQQWQAMAFEPDIDLYVGEGGAAYDRFMRDMRALRRSLLLNVQFIRGMTLYTRGRCAVAAIQSRPEQRDARLAEARAAARRLRAERMPWTLRSRRS